MKTIDLDRHRYISPARDMEFYCDVVCSGNYYFLSIDAGGLSGEPFTLLDIKYDIHTGRHEFEYCKGHGIDRKGDAYPIFECYDDVIKMIDYLNDRLNHMANIDIENIILEFD